ncbi:unnamed protein product, partial [marine sediment metagenome]
PLSAVADGKGGAGKGKCFYPAGSLFTGRVYEENNVMDEAQLEDKPKQTQFPKCPNGCNRSYDND